MRSREVDWSVWGWWRSRVCFPSCWNDRRGTVGQLMNETERKDLKLLQLQQLHCRGCLKCPMFYHKAATAGRKNRNLEYKGFKAMCTSWEHKRHLKDKKESLWCHWGVNKMRWCWLNYANGWNSRLSSSIHNPPRWRTVSPAAKTLSPQVSHSPAEQCVLPPYSSILSSSHVETKKTKRLSSSPAQKLGIMMELTGLKCRVNTTKTFCTVLFYCCSFIHSFVFLLQ